MNLASIDLNLLRVFDAVYRVQNATKAGKLIGLSQPAVSRALTRLRYHMDDELFIRSPAGLRPTPRADELSGPVRRALSMLELALDPIGFDPKTSSWTFTLLVNDYVAGVLLPDFVSYLSSAAPNVNLRLLPTIGRSLEILDQQQADFAITPMGDTPDRFDRTDLTDASFVLIMRQDHDLAEGPMTLKRFASAPHLLFSVRGDDKGFVDEALEEHGLTRRVAMTINQVSIGPAIVAASNMVMIAPRELASKLAPIYDLAIREAPIQGPPLTARVSLIWNRRLASHPAHDWFREKLVHSISNRKSG